MEERIKKIVETLDFNKAEDIEVFNLSGKGYIVNDVVIATALNNRHTFALLGHLSDMLKASREQVLRTEEDGDWVILDLGDALVHLMTQDHRDKYTMEEFLTNFQEYKGE